MAVNSGFMVEDHVMTEAPPRNRRSAGPWISVFLVCTLPLTARAEGYDRYDLSLRFPAVFSRFSPYASVAAMGNAQAASAWASSTNPASAAWPHPELPFSNEIAPLFSLLRFAEGTEAYVAAAAAVLDAGDWGVFVPVATQVRSNHAPISTGPGFKFEASYFQLPWGRRVADNWAIGVNFNYMATDTRFDLAEARLARMRSDDYGVRVGLLHAPLDWLRVGLTADYGYAPDWTDRFNPFAPAAGAVRSTDDTQRVLLRPGLAWQYLPRGSLYADYQVGAFWNDTGTLWVHRFPLGVEYWLVPLGWVVRMGTTIDTRSSPAFTAGTGMAVGRRALANVAYQYGMFPELRPEFGPAQTFAVSLAVGF